MCGLIAGSGRIETRYLVSLGCQSESRGDDSAGVGWVDKGSVPNFLKIAQSPLVAYPVTLYRGIRQAVRAHSPIIGHTRQATTGAVTSDNAHPFLDDGILFAHNGVIHNHADFGKYDVDSQSLIHGIKALNFSKYEGPIALVWIEKGKLHAARKGNPLFRGFKKGAAYVASEEGFLRAIGCSKIKELAEGRLYSWTEEHLEQSMAIPFSTHNTYTKPWRGGYVTRGIETELPYHNGGFWDNEKQEWIKDGRKWDWKNHRYVDADAPDSAIIVPNKVEGDSLAEVDAEEEAMNMELSIIEKDLCLECKADKRLVASDYCAHCMRENFGYNGGH